MQLWNIIFGLVQKVFQILLIDKLIFNKNCGQIYTGNKYCYLQAKLNFHSSFSLHDSGVVKAESNEDESWWELTVTNCHRGHFKLCNENIKEWLFWLYFYFNKIHDCVEKASSTTAKQDRMTANSHQLSSSFDQVFSPVNSIKTGTANPGKSPICLSEANYFFKYSFYM